MSIPENNDYHTIAKWLTREPEIFEILKTRLGQECITKHAEVEDEEVFLKTCTKCKIPTILHTAVRNSEEEDPKCNDLISRLVDNYRIPLQNDEQIEEFNEIFDIEIRKIQQFKDAKETLDEIATRTCVCKRVLLSTTGLKNHKRACEIAKAQPITTTPSTASSTNENTMMLQLMSQMQEDRKSMTNLMEKVLKETPSENVRNEDKKNEKPTEFPKW